MEAEKTKALQLALNYESMTGNPAFRDMMAWLEDSVESLELRAAQASPESKEHFHALFTEWQQRKVVVAGIKNRIKMQLEHKSELEEEAFNERPSSTYLDSGSDTQLPGYSR